jgi:hypothetical protein
MRNEYSFEVVCMLLYIICTYYAALDSAFALSNLAADICHRLAANLFVAL